MTHSRPSALHYSVLATLLPVFSACSPTPIPPLPPAPTQPNTVVSPTNQPTQPPVAQPVSPPPKEASPVIRPPQAKLPLKLNTIKRDGITLTLVQFDARNFELHVADQPKGPGTRWSTAKKLASATDAVAAINAGFFTPEGKPLGLLYTYGTRRGALHNSSLGSGVYYINNQTKRPSIIRRRAWANWKKQAGAAASPEHLLQAGPFLLENSSARPGLSKASSRPRSFVCWDGKNHWAIGHADSCSLAQLAQILRHVKLGNSPVTTALNLDGGRSSDIYAGHSVSNGPKEIRPFWNKPVRNFLILKRK